MISLIFLAGGTGQRMGSSLPKQFLSIHQKPIVQHSLEIFQKFPSICEIVVVCEKTYESFFKGPFLFARPGKRRQDSVYSGLLKTTQEMILIHDSARPFFDETKLFELIETAKEHGAAAFGFSAIDTIKLCSADRVVQKTLNREELWHIQTPQAVMRDLFFQGYQEVHRENLTVTDDLSVVELIGVRPKIVPSASHFLKVTTPIDLKIAEELCATK